MAMKSGNAYPVTVIPVIQTAWFATHEPQIPIVLKKIRLTGRNDTAKVIVWEGRSAPMIRKGGQESE